MQAHDDDHDAGQDQFGRPGADQAADQALAPSATKTVEKPSTNISADVITALGGLPSSRHWRHARWSRR